MKHWMSFPKSEGITSAQAHCDLPAGSYEREFGREGFFGPVTHLYHRHPPTGWSHWEGDLRPRAFDLRQLAHVAHSPWGASALLHNPFMQMHFWQMEGAMDRLVCNADGDQILFVHAGAGDLFCDFGHLSFREGDYMLLPRGTRWRVSCQGRADFLMIEATNDGFRLPDKGLLGEQAIFDPAKLETPAINEQFKAQQDELPWKVVIKRHTRFSTVTFPYNPLDTLGWHGNNLPVKLNWRDIRPVMSHRYHLPPSAHSTFVASRFVVCTFVPRPIETDPGALKVPFFHSNNDYDEILFYHQGAFFSRDNIHPGMMTLHPAGFAHGPHPKALHASSAAPKAETDEVAVMIDTRDAVDIAVEATKVEWAGYADSWKEEKA